MTIVEAIKITGHLPKRFETDDGIKAELFIRRKTKGGYIATFWQMVNGVQDHIISYAHGNTPEEAKQNLKEKILKI